MYLAELLLGKGYEVHGIVRRASTFGTERLDHLYLDPHEAGAKFFVHYGDLSDAKGLGRILAQVRATDVYNLGAQSHLAVSFDQPLYPADVTALGSLRILEAVETSTIRRGTTRRPPRRCSARCRRCRSRRPPRSTRAAPAA